MEFGEIFQLFLDHQNSLEAVFVASSDENGLPNCAPKLLIAVAKPNIVYYVDYTFSRTFANVDQNWQSSLAFMDDKKFIGLRLSGFSQVIDSGREYILVNDKWAKKVTAYQAERIIERVKGIHSDLPHELVIPKNFVIVKFIAEEAAIVRPDRVLRALRNTDEENTAYPVSHPIKKIVELQTRLTEQLEAEKTIKERKKALEKAILEDELTGLYNRRGFVVVVEQQLKIAKRTGKSIALIFSDLDHLKLINDTFGHSAGDQALTETARILKKSFRDSDIVARIGGDEFAIAVTDCDQKELEIVIGRLKANIMVYNQAKPCPYALDLSVGIALYEPSEPIALAELLKRADQKMYEEKMTKKASCKAAV